MRIEFENGSVIETAESNESNAIRGKRIGLWWFNDKDEKEEGDMSINQSLSGYVSYMIEAIREKLGYEPDDDSHDEEVLAYFQRGEKLSKSKHLKQGDVK